MRGKNVSTTVREKAKMYFDYCCDVASDKVYKILWRVWKDDSGINGVCIERECIVIGSNGENINSCG